MRWTGRLLAVVAVCAGSMVVGAMPAAAQGGERIDQFDVELEVEPDGAVAVTETIGYDFGSTARHGIDRIIPVRRRYDDTRDRVYTVTGLQAERSTGPQEYQTEEQGSDLVVRIGESDRTVSGRQVYTIMYGVQGALDGFVDHDELFWNAIGTQWKVPIDRVSVRVVTPAAVTSVACWRGPEGSVQPCAGQTSDGPEAVFTDAGLGPHEALTVTVGFPAGAVPARHPDLQQAQEEPGDGLAGLAAALALVLAAVLAAILALVGLGRGWFPNLGGNRSSGIRNRMRFFSGGGDGGGGDSAGSGGGGGGGDSW